jgi:hypothetical protein
MDIPKMPVEEQATLTKTEHLPLSIKDIQTLVAARDICVRHAGRNPSAMAAYQHLLAVLSSTLVIGA